MIDRTDRLLQGFLDRVKDFSYGLTLDICCRTKIPKVQMPIVSLADQTLILERKCRDGEIDRFQWFCPKCDALLHEVTAVVSDYRADPVSKAYRTLFGDRRTCKKCGNVMPKP